MKRFCLKTFFAIALILSVSLGIGSFFSGVTFAEESNPSIFTTETRSDNSFIMEMKAVARANNSLQRNEQTVTNKLGQEITYLVFSWRELSQLTFHFQLNRSEEISYNSMLFQVSHIRSETLSPVIDSGTLDTLYTNNLEGFSRMNFIYNIDSVVNTQMNETSSSGHDFGLYKFDFSYTSTIKGIESSKVLNSIYVAVIPDDIDKITSNQEIHILYSVSSANELINKFECTLSNDSFKYVNPDRITWIAYGTDIENSKYCLSKKMIEEDSYYVNYIPFWQVYPTSDHGTSFVLDTNGVEGVWTVECIIRNTDGTEKFQVRPILEGLSTIRTPHPSYLWLILLIVGLSIILLVVIALLITLRMKKSEKVW